MSDKSDEKYYVPFSCLSDIPAREASDQEIMLPTWNGEKSVWQAAAEGDIPALQPFLANGVDVNVADGNEDSTPLICAAGLGHRQAVEFLLEKGADVNATDMYGMSPLMAASAGGHIETVKLLLESGADVAAKLGVLAGYVGETAKELAAHNGYADVVAMLEKAKAQ